MTCFSPLQGYESNELTSTGKRKTTFSLRNARTNSRLFSRIVPCNRCVGCRMRYSREWAVRCMHEASLYGSCNSFITLTYNDKYLPRIESLGRIIGTGSLNYDHWTLFMKRFRKNIQSKSYMSRFNLETFLGRVRFFMGPEYGDLNYRPHYHAIIFNYDFPDQVPFLKRNGYDLNRSALLESFWTDPISGESLGYSTVGSCTFESAAYVARYMLKKVKGDDIDGRYRRCNSETGEVYFVAPEKARMSNQNGIAFDWWNQYHDTDVDDKDFITLNGSIVRPPRYYDSLLDRVSPEKMQLLRESRQLSMREFAFESTPERLQARELCLLSSVNNLPRNIYKSIKEF